MADKPVTREEKYLAYLTGDYTGEIPKPITRKEKYLYELCLKGIGGEISPEEIKAAVNEYLEKNPVKPGATEEQAQQIEQNKTDIASLKEDLSNKITKFYASNQGETHITDSDNGKIQDMMLYGKSSQDGTPTPENPVEIKSVVNPTVKVTNEDGLKVQSVTLNNITLNAIPVSSGGNVTIDGQQYIADYVDVERGKVVKRVKVLNISNLDKSKWGFRTDTSGVIWHSTRYYGTSSMLDFDTNINAMSNIAIYGEIGHDAQGTFRLVDAKTYLYQFNLDKTKFDKVQDFTDYLVSNNVYIQYALKVPQELDLKPEEIVLFKSLSANYPTTNISINSEQLDGRYTVFNYPISMQNGWNYVKQQIGDTREYIYDMDARAQDTDLQAAEAYVNSEYAVALTELEV